MQKQTMSVLVVEDNSNVRAALVLLLNRAFGVAETRETDSAEQALVWLETDSFTAVIADFHLTGMSGVELLQTMRSKGNRTPVLLLSGALDKRSVLKALEETGVECLPKPFQISELGWSLDRLMAA